MQMLRSADSVECPEQEAFSPAVSSVSRTLSRLPIASLRSRRLSRCSLKVRFSATSS